ncbi:hypothetical protein LWI29_021479 [Acer saccharum]|uniref:Uncharacterized protein n=1 Tax=Acer saccharum TaxID=4024 RepID=A0AA39VLF9_ACESA|nr:hypothetical protein LWI29_021479 [Acer saccharum]
MNPTWLATAALISPIAQNSNLSLNSLIAPNPHKMVQYLEPWQLFRESMKRTYDMRPAVFLGLSITDNIVSLATCDSDYPNSRFSLPCHYGTCPIDYQSISDKLLDCVLEVKINCRYDLLGIVVANHSSKMSSLEIDDLMHHLFEIGTFSSGTFNSLKYTRWEDDIASRSALFECYGSGWRTFPVDGSNSEVCSEERADLEIFSAHFMIGAFVNVFKTLHGAEYLRQKRGWIPREGEKEAVQDVPQQSRAEPLHMFSLLNRVKDDRELDSDEEKEMEMED